MKAIVEEVDTNLYEEKEENIIPVGSPQSIMEQGEEALLYWMTNLRKVMIFPQIYRLHGQFSPYQIYV